MFFNCEIVINFAQKNHTMPLTRKQKQWLDSHPELKPSQSMKKRKASHDYSSRCIYMVTMCVERRQPVLGTLRSPDEQHRTPYVALSELGRRVLEAWRAIPCYYPEVEVLKLQLMPDHMHGIIFVKEQVPYRLGTVINGFRKGCNDAVRTLGDGHFVKLWEDGYNDTILVGANHLEKMRNYIADNPRRRWVKDHNGWLFTRHKMMVDGREVDVMGNMCLLNFGAKTFVQCTNRLDAKTLGVIKDNFLKQAREGSVVVTAGISTVEKAVMNWALDNSHEMILVIDNGMSDLWKPSGKLFDACASGHLLLVAPWEHRNYGSGINRSRCLAMNDVALAIVEGKISRNSGRKILKNNLDKGTWMGIEDGGLGDWGWGIGDWGWGTLSTLHSFLSPLPFLLFYRKAVPCDLLTDCEGTFLPLSFVLCPLSFVLPS